MRSFLLVRHFLFMDDRNNNIGFLRLLFASFVILSHSFLLIDGNRSRETLMSLFGTLSFGEVGVDGFFLISGYLITKSYNNCESYGQFVWKRILRIYPAFVVAYLFSSLIAVPMAGGNLAEISGIQWLKLFNNMVLLKSPPSFTQAFSELKQSSLNGSMWTLSYELKCYLFTIIIFILLAYSRKLLLLLITTLMAAAMIGLYLQFNTNEFASFPDFTMYPVIIRFLSIFLCGSAFYVFRDKIVYRGLYALAFGVTLFFLMFNPLLAEPALSVLGGYIIFWLSFNVKNQFLGNINSNRDISYGVYLYGWPIQNLIILYFPGVTPLELFISAMAIAAMFGLMSWRFVEKPFLTLKGLNLYMRYKVFFGRI